MAKTNAKMPHFCRNVNEPLVIHLDSQLYISSLVTYRDPCYTSTFVVMQRGPQLLIEIFSYSQRSLVTHRDLQLLLEIFSYSQRSLVPHRDLQLLIEILSNSQRSLVTHRDPQLLIVILSSTYLKSLNYKVKHNYLTFVIAFVSCNKL